MSRAVTSPEMPIILGIVFLYLKTSLWYLKMKMCFSVGYCVPPLYHLSQATPDTVDTVVVPRFLFLELDTCFLSIQKCWQLMASGQPMPFVKGPCPFGPWSRDKNAWALCFSERWGRQILRVSLQHLLRLEEVFALTPILFLLSFYKILLPLPCSSESKLQ